MAQRCSMSAIPAEVPGGIVSATNHTSSSLNALPSSMATAPARAPSSAPSSPAAPRPTRAPASAPNSIDSSWVKSVSSTAWISPSSSLLTNSRSIRRMMSCSRSRLSSARISPSNLPCSKPTTSICTGPNSMWPPSAVQKLLLLRVELGLGQHTRVEQFLEALERLDAVGLRHRGGRGRGGRRRWRGLLHLGELGVLLVLVLLGCRAPLAHRVAGTSDHGGAHQRAPASN